MSRPSLVIVVLAQLGLAACGGSSSSERSSSERPTTSNGNAAAVAAPVERTAPPVFGAATPAGDASTNLETTPLSAADYALYSNIMGGASALLSTITPADRDALAFAKKVDAGQAKVTPSTEKLLAQARALQHKDEELAQMQGVGDRYRAIKARVESVIGPKAHAPAADDRIGQENLRFLEPHRQTIERLQAILRDPLSRPATPNVALE